MQVESVACAAGRRDVLYVFFYLLCLIFYVLYLDKKKQTVIKYILSLLFALLSLLSKGQALTIPFTLILISLFLNKKWNSKSFWIDKIPYFIFSVIIAYKVFSAPQYAEGNFTSTSYLDASIPVFYRLIYACYGFVQYIILLLFPYKLSLVHPYPEIGGKYGIPTFYYLFVILFIGLIYFFFRYSLKKKYLWFGLAFFAVNIFMLLQLIPNSYGIMNDHYVYFAGVGIFLMVGERLSNELFNKKHSFILKFIFIVYFIFLGTSSFLRIDAFKNSMAVWSDVIKKYPECYMAYNNRGLEYYYNGSLDKAIDDYTKVIEIKPNFPPIYNNRGIVYNDMGDYKSAVNDFTNAIKLNPKYRDAYYNRGNAFVHQGIYDVAITDYTKVIELDPNNATTYNNRGAIYDEEKIYDKAINDYTKAIELKPDYALAYNNRGSIYKNVGSLGKACLDFTKAAELGSEEAKENVEKFCNHKN
jgi:tetratricopeptide (TPR) repeat protein